MLQAIHSIFFHTQGDETIEIRRSVPKALRVASILQSAEDEVAVVTFYTKGGFDFFVQ